MKLLVVDDEPLARQRLIELVQELGNHQVVAEFACGNQALDFCAEQAIDVVLLDIHMPGLSGLETAHQLADLAEPPLVIFVTAYDEHALQAFDAKAMDYLLKPVRKERLAEALAKISPLIEAINPLDDRAENVFLSVSFRGGLERIDIDNVFYLQADSKYIVVRHPHGEALMETSLRILEEQFAQRFIRIHRNALVARNKVRGLERDIDGQALIVFEEIDDRLAISRRHLPAVRRWLKGAFLHS